MKKRGTKSASGSEESEPARSAQLNADEALAKLREWWTARTEREANFSELIELAKAGDFHSARALLDFGGGFLAGNARFPKELAAYLSEVLCNAADAADQSKGKARNSAIVKALLLAGNKGRKSYENQQRDTDICKAIDYLKGLNGKVLREPSKRSWSAFEVSKQWLEEHGIILGVDAIRTIYEAKQKK